MYGAFLGYGCLGLFWTSITSSLCFHSETHTYFFFFFPSFLGNCKSDIDFFTNSDQLQSWNAAITRLATVTCHTMVRVLGSTNIVALQLPRSGHHVFALKRSFSNFRGHQIVHIIFLIPRYFLGYCSHCE